MDRIIAAALVALALPGSVLAEPAEPIDEAPLASEADVSLVRAFVFGSLIGPQRTELAFEPAVEVDAPRADVLDWVSPVFVWLEPGYAYAETSIAFE